MRWGWVLVVLACLSCSRSGVAPSPGVPANPNCASGQTSGLAEAVHAWQRATESGDVDRVVGAFDDDATAFYPRPQPSLGKEAIRTNWADFFSRRDAHHPVTTEKVTTATCGDFGYVIGDVQGSWT